MRGSTLKKTLYIIFHNYFKTKKCVFNTCAVYYFYNVYVHFMMEIYVFLYNLQK